jgi:hypothetical protein
MKKFNTILILTIFTFYNTAAQSVSGTWIFSSNNVNITMLLNQDGTGEFQGMQIKYKVQNGQLLIDDGIRPVAYNYQLNQNTLVLSGGGMPMSVTFLRSGTTGNSAVSQGVNQNQMQGQFQGNNQPQNQYNNLNNYNAATNQNNQTPSNQANNPQAMAGQLPGQGGGSDIHGIWEGQQGKLVFYTDGYLLYNNVSYQYSVSGNRMIISAADGSTSFNYSLEGNSLTLSQNTNSAKYSKSAQLRQESVDPQLVGKWCILNSSYNSYSGGGSSSEECITLNQDGTYIYSYSAERSAYASNQSAYGGTSNQNGDRGTWKTDGITISSFSQTTGKASRYMLGKEINQNGDPVLVIGGKKFVTAYNRKGW